MGLFRRERHGYWVIVDHLFRADDHECSECRRVFDDEYDICPYCGAVMDLGDVDDLIEMDLILEDD